MAEKNQSNTLFALLLIIIGGLSIYFALEIIFLNNGYTGMYGYPLGDGGHGYSDALYTFMGNTSVNYQTTLLLAFIVFFVNGIFNIIFGVKRWKATFRS